MSTIIFFLLLFSCIAHCSRAELMRLRCPDDLTFMDVDTCAVYIPALPVPSFYNELGNLTELNQTLFDSLITNTSDVWFPSGDTYINWYGQYDSGGGDDAFTNISCTFVIHVRVRTAGNYSACGEGTCSPTYPYSCACPYGTSGAYCCGLYPILEMDEFENGTMNNTNTTRDEQLDSRSYCGGHGTCMPGAICSCDIGYSGSYCCPVNNRTGLTCSGRGCCMATGQCACWQQILNGTMLNNTAVTQFLLNSTDCSFNDPIVASTDDLILSAEVIAAIVSVSVFVLLVLVPVLSNLICPAALQGSRHAYRRILHTQQPGISSV